MRPNPRKPAILDGLGVLEDEILVAFGMVDKDN